MVVLEPALRMGLIPSSYVTLTTPGPLAWALFRLVLTFLLVEELFLASGRERVAVPVPGLASETATSSGGGSEVGERDDERPSSVAGPAADPRLEEVAGLGHPDAVAGGARARGRRGHSTGSIFKC